MFSRFLYLSIKYVSILAFVFAFDQSVFAAYYVKYTIGNKTIYLRNDGNGFRYCKAEEVPSNVIWSWDGGTWTHYMQGGGLSEVTYGHWNGRDPDPAEVKKQVEIEKKRKDDIENKRKEEQVAKEWKEATEKAQVESAERTAKNVAKFKANDEKARKETREKFEREYAESSARRKQQMDQLASEREAKKEELEAEKKARRERIKQITDKYKVSGDEPCFPEETLISVVDESQSKYYSVPISSIREGDLVVSCNLEMVGGQCEVGRVDHVMTRTTDYLIRLGFKGVVLRTTGNHPFYVVNENKWIQAKDLIEGDYFQTITGEIVPLDSIEVEEGETAVYNLNVQGNHNYFACDVLVHNCEVPVSGSVRTLPRILNQVGQGSIAPGPVGLVASAAAAGYAIHKATQPSQTEESGEVQRSEVQAPSLMRRAWDYFSSVWSSNQAAEDSEGGADATQEPKRVFEPSPKHGPVQRGDANPAPKNPQETLDNSVEISKNTSRRVGVDKENGEFNVFDETQPGKGVFHGHTRTWGELTEAMKSALIKAGLVNHKGKIL